MLDARDTGALGRISTLTSKERTAFSACVGGGRPDVQLRHPHANRNLGNHARPCGSPGHSGTASLGVRRMDHARVPRRPQRGQKRHGMNLCLECKRLLTFGDCEIDVIPGLG